MEAKKKDSKIGKNTRLNREMSSKASIKWIFIMMREFTEVKYKLIQNE